MGEQENMDEIDKEEIGTGVGSYFQDLANTSAISPLALYKLGLAGRFDEPADGICTKCGSEMKRILYGFPSRMPDEDDDYVLGGCVILPGAPQFSCPKCAKDQRL
jgi:hypothetical protein